MCTMSDRHFAAFFYPLNIVQNELSKDFLKTSVLCPSEMRFVRDTIHISGPGGQMAIATPDGGRIFGADQLTKNHSH